MDSPSQNLFAFSTFIQLEASARQADSVEALRYTMVNELRRLVPFRQAALIIGGGNEPIRLEATSGVAVLELDSPFVRWLTRVANRLAFREDASTVHLVTPDMLAPPEREDWKEWMPANVLWCPLLTRDGVAVGALWLARDQEWQETEAVMLERLAGCYAHAWRALTGTRRRMRPNVRKSAMVAVPVAMLLALALPVRQSALAPAEIVATAPLAVSAPIDGVIARFKVKPNQPVKAGEPLLEFDDTTLRNQAEVADRTLGVAQAELRQATQGAMIDRKAAGQMALIDAQVKLRQTELDYARTMLARILVRAERDGIAVFTDENDWIGRPVVTGQRILQIADPAHTELNISLPVRDAIVLTPGAPVDLFLDVEPLSPKPATLTSASYEAEMTPAGALSYRVRATFSLDLPPPRIGLQGTAKIYGERVPLVLYLFRRPLSALRQTLGF